MTETKAFYPTNVGGIKLMWVDDNGKDVDAGTAIHTFTECCGTLHDENDDMVLDIYNQMIIDVPSNNVCEYPVWKKIHITSIFNNDMKWIDSMNNKCTSVNNKYYINPNSVSLQYIEINVDFKFIRIHYNFCQNCFGCSDSRRMMSGAVNSLMKLDDKEEYLANRYLGAEIYW